MVLFYSGVAGKRPGKAKGWIIHNDAGSQYANAAFYRSWLPTHDAYLGFAHVYTANDGTHYAEDYDYMAYHAANSEGNMWYLGIEICQSMGDEATFRQNEKDGFKIVAQWFIDENEIPNRTTVRLHKEFSSTACPHRSWALHGQSTNAIKDYFVAQIVLTMADLKGLSVKEDKEELKFEELKNMLFLFTAEGEGATFYFDGKDTIVFSDDAQLDMIVGNYQLTHEGKDIPRSPKFSKEQFKIWTSMYPTRIAKKTW